MTPVTLPPASTDTSRTYDRTLISQLPVLSATGSIVTAELDLALTWHPKPEHMPQFTHAERPPYGLEMIAMGPSTTVQPSFAAPILKSAPDAFSGMGGTGYSFDIGAMKGELTRRPEIPISHSACV